MMVFIIINICMEIKLEWQNHYQMELSDMMMALKQLKQMSKDVTAFLMWAAEPHLESRHQMGFKAIVYLIILTILVYFSMKRIWSRVETEV